MIHHINGKNTSFLIVAIIILGILLVVSLLTLTFIIVRTPIDTVSNSTLQNNNSIDTISIPNTPITNSFKIMTSEPQVQVYIDNTLVGNTDDTGILSTTLTTGIHTIKLSKNGFDDYSTTMNSLSNTPAEITVTLLKVTNDEPVQNNNPIGYLTITTSTTDVTVSINNLNYGQIKSVLDTVSLSPGTYTIKISKKGYETATQTATITATQTTEIHFNPLIPVLSTGNLFVDSIDVPGMNVYVDDVLKGVTPLTLSDLETGSHTIKISDGRTIYNDYITTTTVIAGQTATVSTTLNIPEPIVFAVNKYYADKTPDWKERADNAINTINKVFLKTTKKEYKISKYLVYDDTDYEKTWYDKNFHVQWNNIGTTTIILLVTKDGLTLDELLKITPSNTINVAMDANIDGVTYHNLLIGNSDSHNMLLNKGELTNYEYFLELPLHELGHTNGLAVPDWYLYSYIDCTNKQPLLPAYNIREVYPKDPMTSNGANEHQFNELNSKIINMNLDHKYGLLDINKLFAKTSKVYVTDSQNNPISDATVEISCVRKSCFYCSNTCTGGSGTVDSNSPTTPEQVIHTNSSGIVEYTGASGKWDMQENTNTECLAKAIKVYYQGKSKAKYVQFLDLQEDYILRDQQTHVDHIIID